MDLSNVAGLKLAIAEVVRGKIEIARVDVHLNHAKGGGESDALVLELLRLGLVLLSCGDRRLEGWVGRFLGSLRAFQSTIEE